MIEGFKEIARILREKTGFEYASETVRKLASRGHDPLPVERFDGRVGITYAALDAWIARRRGVRKSA